MAKMDGVWPVNGRAFEDILDGYFPLAESVRQMMARHDFATMWIVLLHAPIMNIRGLPPTAPVPLSLPKTYSGMIDHMSLLAVQSGEGVRLSGTGSWFWVDGRAQSETFPVSTRLGEPAFVRGVGFGGVADANARATVALARPDPSRPVDSALAAATGRLGWRASRAWGLNGSGSGIRRETDADAPDTPFGRRFDAPGGATETPSRSVPPPADWTYLLVDLSPDQPDEEALELARRL